MGANVSAITALTFPTLPVSFKAAATPEPVALIQTTASKSGLANKIAEVDAAVSLSSPLLSPVATILISVPSRPFSSPAIQ